MPESDEARQEPARPPRAVVQHGRQAPRPEPYAVSASVQVGDAHPFAPFLVSFLPGPVPVVLVVNSVASLSAVILRVIDLDRYAIEKGGIRVVTIDSRAGRASRAAPGAFDLRTIQPCR